MPGIFGSMAADGGGGGWFGSDGGAGGAARDAKTTKPLLIAMERILWQDDKLRDEPQLTHPGDGGLTARLVDDEPAHREDEPVTSDG